MHLNHGQQMIPGRVGFQYPNQSDSDSGSCFGENHGQMLALQAAFSQALGPKVLSALMPKLRVGKSVQAVFRNMVREWVEDRPQRYTILGETNVRIPNPLAAVSTGFNTVESDRGLMSGIVDRTAYERHSHSIRVGLLAERSVDEVARDFQLHDSGGPELSSAIMDLGCLRALYFTWAAGYLDRDIIEHGVNLILVEHKDILVPSGSRGLVFLRFNFNPHDGLVHLRLHEGKAPIGARLFFIPYDGYDSYLIW